MAIKLPGGRTLAVMTVGVLAGTLFTASGSAVASSAAAEIHACVHKQTRYTRIVNATAKCRPTEIRIRWGQESLRAHFLRWQAERLVRLRRGELRLRRRRQGRQGRR
ncbi:hypothetical protein OG884_13635 [Streptosporangium sp. NBC_01755]|uniref:hypothetical protein n=1 Tax=unclassified Streptosporangium TaxID=2632669 RepID=UPI002DD85236|nr:MULTISPECIES: hypothetical protein [unclassified Streptosporangium]WSA25718.1 hypothetical protein OIE13_33230 [Streptosporangium sp. NBC_01810]WSD02892.1 hypothetical protein OG884_13635 [Streptosporangium sp. NBC_01755]